MTKQELLGKLKNVPDNAIVYIVSDHGQVPEEAGSISYTNMLGELPFYGDDIDWMPDDQKVTAVLIS